MIPTERGCLKIKIKSRKAHKEKTLSLQSLEIMSSILYEPSENSPNSFRVQNPERVKQKIFFCELSENLASFA
jgi:hypothetical protein